MNVRQLGGRLGRAAAAWLAVALIVPAGPAGAQADSLARVAREHYGRAAAALRAHDLSGARAAIAAAAAAWPTQPAYLVAAARLAARAGDTAATAAWLERLARLGAGPPLDEQDADIQRLASAPGVAAGLARLRENREPRAASEVAFRIPDPEFFAEGIDADSTTGRVYVASIRLGRVASFADGRLDRTFTLPADSGFGAAFGVRVDPARRRLWVTAKATALARGHPAGAPERASLAMFDLNGGRLLASARLDDGAAHTLGDLVVSRAGDVYVSDSESPAIFRARLTPGGRLALERWVTSPLFRSLQGLCFDEDEDTLYVADYSHGLLAIDVEAGTVREIPAPAEVTTLGLDGLVWWNGGIVAVQNGLTPSRVIALRLSAGRDRIERARVLDRNIALATQPTIAARLGSRLLYVADSHWDRYDAQGRLTAGAALGPTTILVLPLVD